VSARGCRSGPSRGDADDAAGAADDADEGELRSSATVSLIEQRLAQLRSGALLLYLRDARGTTRGTVVTLVSAGRRLRAMKASFSAHQVLMRAKPVPPGVGQRVPVASCALLSACL